MFGISTLELECVKTRDNVDPKRVAQPIIASSFI